MLVLSRHRDQVIRIGEDIILTIVDIRGDKVRVGIDAPQHIAVHREEVFQAIQREIEKAEKKSAEPSDGKACGVSSDDTAVAPP